MQHTNQIAERDVRTVVDAFFKTGGVMFEGADTYDRPSREFHDAESTCAYIRSEREKGNVSVFLAFYDASAGGYIHVRKTKVDPKRFNGAQVRFTMEGWGLVYVNLGFVEAPQVEINISVNSQTRATNRSATDNRMKSPELWNWPAVERHARRAIRCLKQCASKNR